MTFRPAIPFLTLILAAGPALAGNCTALNLAFDNWSHTPSYVIAVTSDRSGVRDVGELIQLDGMTYSRSDQSGRWRSWPRDKDFKIPAGEPDRSVCRADGTAVLNGEPADIVVSRLVQRGVDMEMRLWISRVTGLPLRSVTIDHKSATGERDVIMYHYRGLHAPAQADVDRSPTEIE